MFHSRGLLLDALQKLSDWLAEHGETKRHGFLICGASCVLYHGLPQLGATRDVDVLGGCAGDHVIHLEELPEAVARGAEWVRWQYKQPLEPEWLNTSASVTVMPHHGLPRGILERATRHDFPPCLAAYFCARPDLIALKFLHTLTPNPSSREKAKSDLRCLAPTSEEIEHTRSWLASVPNATDAYRQLWEAVLLEFALT